MSELSGERLAELRQAFASIDVSGDGFISQEEFLKHFPGLPAEALGSLEQTADADGDGRISFEEFVRLLG
ncbi:EF-hand domain-containing protein [Nonomuraea dietziae]|uniref:Ca2+-binding EF-hand superfamily protein n=1 Tax=Nonomuraea dietziae TaxID=65515 RepID=A0A7W5VMY5_9ACTN|nr:EF-hand domain-containing protein [Nonomuraea dietziae]MBB3730922.1 Ca2+-binding EF-hand superfamily protein [Nonomuraea dietziae]